MNAPIILLAITALSTAQAAPLTLACEGTATHGPAQNRSPVSISIILDLGSQTGEFDNLPMKIQSITDTRISFSTSSDPHSSYSSVPIKIEMGSIDRVTGEVQAFYSKSGVHGLYSLKCKPAQF